MAEWQNGRMKEWQNGRMAEWQNGRMAECHFPSLKGVDVVVVGSVCNRSAILPESIFYPIPPIRSSAIPPFRRVYYSYVQSAYLHTKYVLYQRVNTTYYRA